MYYKYTSSAPLAPCGNTPILTVASSGPCAENVKIMAVFVLRKKTQCVCSACKTTYADSHKHAVRACRFEKSNSTNSIYHHMQNFPIRKSLIFRNIRKYRLQHHSPAFVLNIAKFNTLANVCIKINTILTRVKKNKKYCKNPFCFLHDVSLLLNFALHL